MGEGGSGSLRDGSKIEGRALCFFRQQTTSFVNLCLGTSPLDAFCLIYILGGGLRGGRQDNQIISGGLGGRDACWTHTWFMESKTSTESKHIVNRIRWPKKKIGGEETRGLEYRLKGLETPKVFAQVKPTQCETLGPNFSISCVYEGV